MFSLPWRKSKLSQDEVSEIPTVKLDWLSQFMPLNDKLPRPDWELIYEYVDNNLKILS